MLRGSCDYRGRHIVHVPNTALDLFLYAPAVLTLEDLDRALGDTGPVVQAVCQTPVGRRWFVEEAARWAEREGLGEEETLWKVAAAGNLAVLLSHLSLDTP